MNSGGLEDAIKKNLPTWSTIPVGSHPANSTPEGVQDMLGYAIGEWCANKFIGSATSKQASLTETDLVDLQSDRSVRGYYHRLASRRQISLPGPSQYHKGRTWTRVGAHPIEAARNEARYGIRVVEETESPR